MGIAKVKIENFRTIDRMNLDVKESGISCLLGKNGVGKTTIINAIRYLYKVAEHPYDIEQIIDKKNSYVQRTKIELVFDFTKLHKKTSNQYIEENLYDFKTYIKDNQLPLKMTQYKNGLVEWYPINDVYKVRRLLRVFPVYIVDTRDISLYEWSELWDVVCDIAISGIEQDSDLVKSNLSSVFREIYGDKYVKVYGIIENIFKEERVTINEKDYKRRFKNSIVTNFGGDIFKVNEENIGYYSAGMNSLKYITLFLKLIIELSETAWKDITIIFDEPEICLHPQYIDELADIFSSYGVKNTILISTHSTHLISALIRNYANIYFYQVYSINYDKLRRTQNCIVLNGFVVDENIRLSRKKLKPVSRVLFYMERNRYERSADWAKKYNEEMSKYINEKNVLIEKEDDLINLLAGYRAFLICAVKHSDSENFTKRSGKIIGRIEKQITFIEKEKAKTSLRA